MSNKIIKALAQVDAAIKRVNLITKNLPDDSGQVLLCISVQEGKVTYSRLGEIQICAAALSQLAKMDPKLAAAVRHAASQLAAA